MTRRILLILLITAVVVHVPHAAFSQTKGDTQAQRYYLKGKFLEDWNEITYAYSFYKAAAEKCPESGILKLALARVAVTLGKFSEAKEYVEPLINNAEYKTEASIYMSEASYRMGDPRRAAEYLESIEEDLDYMRRVGVLTFLSKIYFEMKDEKSAQRTLEKIVKITPDDMFTNYRLGLLAAQDSNAEEAIEYFKVVLSQNPAYNNLPVLLSSILVHENRREEAKQVLERAFAVNPAEKEVKKTLFVMIYEDKEYSRGIGLLTPMFENDELDVNGLVELGRLYFEKGDLKEALVVYKSMMDKKCNKAAVLRIIADLELRLDKYRDAAETMEKLVEMEPNDFSNYTGLLFISHGLTGNASSPEQNAVITAADSARYINTALKIVGKDSPRDNYLMGLILDETGSSERAIEFLIQAEKLTPDDKKVVLELAQVLEKTGRSGEALERVKLLYEKDSKDPTLMNYYGYLLAVNGDELDFAETLLDRVLKEDPRNGYYLDSLGWIKFKKGEYKDALRILLDAADSIADDPTIWEHIGDTYVRLQAMNKAEKAYRRSVELEPGSRKVLAKLREISADEPEK